MFEDKTYENLLQRCLDNAKDGIDIRPGSIFYDACAAKCLVLADTYASLDILNDQCHVATAVGDNLDKCGKDHSVTRQPAVSMKCRSIFIGAEPEIGSRFFVDGIFFELKDDLDELYPNDEELLAEGTQYLEAEISGTAANIVETGYSLVPYKDIEGLQSATVGEIIVSGSDVEDDESYRGRIQDKIGGPAENGNKYHYKVWCEECPGAGSITARIFTLAKVTDDVLNYNVPNWVTAVLLKDDGNTVSDATAALVQEYVDPDMEGLGEGKANAGAHVMVIKATEVNLDIKVSVEMASETYSIEDAEEEIRTKVQAYLKELALTPISFIGAVAQPIIVRTKRIGSLISTSETIVDYDNLEIRLDEGNFNTSNISIEPNYIVVLGDVKVSELAVLQEEES